MRGGRGPPCARHRQFQPVPADPPQGTAEPVSQAGGTSGETHLRKGKMLHSSKGKKYGKQPCEPQGQRRRRGGGAPGAGAEGPRQPVEETMLEQIFTMHSAEDTTLEQVDMP